MFENYVNYAGSKTLQNKNHLIVQFENYVNYAGSKTQTSLFSYAKSFENYVNYAGSKTAKPSPTIKRSLRTM